MLEKNPYKIVVHLPKSAEADQIQTFAYMVTRRESSYGRCKPPKKLAYLGISIVQVDDEMRGFHSRYTGRAIHPHWSYLHHRLNHILPYKRIYADNFCLKICQIAIKELFFFLILPDRVNVLPRILSRGWPFVWMWVHPCQSELGPCHVQLGGTCLFSVAQKLKYFVINQWSEISDQSVKCHLGKQNNNWN